MNIVFLSNYFNHHQKPFSDEMYALIGNNYSFIETIPMEKQRVALGWGMHQSPCYVHRSYEDIEKCQKLVNDADVVITGSAPEIFLKYRKKKNKLIIRYSERLFKKNSLKEFIKKFLIWHKNNPYNKPIFTLCASGYTSLDLERIYLFRGKTYKWGYFPEKRSYENIDFLIKKKIPKSILWVARFIDWKHPEFFRFFGIFGIFGIFGFLLEESLAPFAESLAPVDKPWIGHNQENNQRHE